jgi:hypothetical protein
MKRRSSFFNINDIILYGKWKNHKARIVGFGQDDHGNPTVEIEPIPKGRKKNKVLGLYKIWHATMSEKISCMEQNVVNRFRNLST